MAQSIALETSTTRTGSLFDRDRTVAGHGFNRWLVPPAALAIHLCIGMAYGLSVFWLPLSRAVGVSKPLACPGQSIWSSLVSTTCDWAVSDLLVTFELAIVVLGISAALFGSWLERAGPRKAGFVAALCWSGGFVVAALGVVLHQLWLIWLGIGGLGGVGLGLGYISPVSTLVKWFPDRRGMATGMAVMGFGGGAMIGSPLANKLMAHFADGQSVGVAPTLLVMAAIYFCFMAAGAFAYRVPPATWTPANWTPKAGGRMVTAGNLALADVHKTPQFWLVWVVLCMNVSAGIGILSMASPMLQEIFAGSLAGHPGVGLSALDAPSKLQVAAVAGGFVGLLSLFNIGGRFAWASVSDRIGRKATYVIFFALGIVLYAVTPSLAHAGLQALFVLSFCVLLSMYGGGFATVPAYLADLFGTQFVGAIHGRLLTAWSVAGVVGPLIVGTIRDHELASGVDRALVYDRTMDYLAALLVVGLVCNALVRPVAARWFDKGLAPAKGPVTAGVHAGDLAIGTGWFNATALLAWAAVGVPLLWGVYQTLSSAKAILGF